MGYSIIKLVEAESTIMASPADRRQQMAGKNAYKNNWIAEKLDRINLTVPKGQKDQIKAHAEACGESVNAFINRAIDEAMERDGA